jgi:GNAT superfamily N-acetyltransferase
MIIPTDTVPNPSGELITGWESNLPVADSLLRRFLFAYADRIDRMARRSGGRSERSDDARFVDLASPFHFDNAVVLLRPPTDIDLEAVIARARAFFPPTRSWVLLSAWTTTDLSELGLRLVGHPPLMLRLPAPLPFAPAELRVVEVDGPARLGDFERTLIAGFPISAGADGAAIFDPRQLGDVFRLFVGYVEESPVSVAGAAVGHGVVEVDWVATLPSARGRGYGGALTAAAVAVAPDLPAVLLASDPGRSVYRRLGFIDLLRCTLWEAHPCSLP